MDVLKEDADRLFSYNTKQQVKIVDRWLGLLNIFLQLAVVSYIVGYVFVYDRGYLQYEEAKGIASALFRGDVVAHSSSGENGGRTRYFAADEITYPPLENGNVFVATKVTIENQSRGVCEDYSMPCESDEDCSQAINPAGVCTAQKYCKEPSWCPDNDSPEVYKLATENMQLWLKSAIQFYSLNPKRVFATNFTRPILYPQEGYNTFSVQELLLFCEPPVRYEEVSELGAAIEIIIRWECNVASEKQCLPDVEARRIDVFLDENDTGFSFAYPVYRDSTGDTRDLYKMSGIRFYIRTVGTGREMSVTAIVFKLSTGIALLALAPIVTDFIMLRFLKFSRKYHARKYEYSQDLGDYFDELEEMQRRTTQATSANEESSDDGAGDNLEDIAWKQRLNEDE